MIKIKQRPGQRKISAWSRSERRNAAGLTFKEVARASLAQINANRHLLPKCSAMAKSTGERCKHLAMGNGKCRYHGGGTPSGDQWHVIQADVAGVKNSMARFDAKLTKAQKARRARQRKLRLATDAERASYEKWLWSHPAGSAARRAARRADSRMKQLISEEKRELSHAAQVEKGDPELIAIQARLAKLKSMSDLIRQSKTGVFQ